MILRLAFSLVFLFSLVSLTEKPAHAQETPASIVECPADCNKCIVITGPEDVFTLKEDSENTLKHIYRFKIIDSNGNLVRERILVNATLVNLKTKADGSGPYLERPTIEAKDGVGEAVVFTDKKPEFSPQYVLKLTSESIPCGDSAMAGN